MNSGPGSTTVMVPLSERKNARPRALISEALCFSPSVIRSRKPEMAEDVIAEYYSTAKLYFGEDAAWVSAEPSEAAEGFARTNSTDSFRSERNWSTTRSCVSVIIT